jgi:tetratricopeptide (TPR) repeat protein
VLIKTEGAHFIDTAAYLNVPHEMLVFRARGLLAAGKVEEAMVQARACLDVTPGHLELAAGMVPELDRLGRTKEADELFGRVRAAYRKVLADYPDSPAARHALAALGAGCRRELDRSLRYATEAVAADPKSAGYRETLAEVHFRRGERAKALEIMKALAEEHPRSRLYRRQLARYRTGDVASPYPDVEE